LDGEKLKKIIHIKHTKVYRTNVLNLS